MNITESTLAGAPILSIADATPFGLSLELRCPRRHEINVTLCQGNQVQVWFNNVPVQCAMVGRVTNELSCLYLGTAAIDILPEAAAAIDVWLGKQIAKAVA